MSDKLKTFMRAIDDELLEEAKMPVQKQRAAFPWLQTAAAACLLILFALPFFHWPEDSVTLATLSDMGYSMILPANAQRISYNIVTVENQDVAEASFVIQETEYTYRAIKTSTPQYLSTRSDPDAAVLSWSSDDLELQLLSSDGTTSVSWYDQDNQTQWSLSAAADSLEVLTTANQILQETGLNLAVAPPDAESVTFDAFLFDDLTVAETVFTRSGVTYSYRMAATADLDETFQDISGTELPYEHSKNTKISWCTAKIHYNENGAGKIIWFDIVPGILYSLTMDSCASEAALLEMAGALYVPAQNNS